MKSTYELIAQKRDGAALEPGEIEWLVERYTAGKLADYQMSAFLMAAFLNGLDATETAALTAAMLKSGKSIKVAGLDRPLIDKHSTGGVGDKLSLTLSPLLAGMGIAVGMFSGRGLGHTGGTLDKLESIPGMQVFFSVATFERLLKKHHMAIMGQTSDIAPADKKIYALRDASGTVESIPLIVASIMSKKLALKSDGIVFDVKSGNGAFMKDSRKAAELARALLEVSRHNNLAASALQTNMNQPTGRMIGNFLEVVESVEVLQGAGPKDTVELTVELSAQMMKIAGIASNLPENRKRLRQELGSGAAYERFAAYVKSCKGEVGALEKPKTLLGKAHKSVVASGFSGYIAGFETARLGYLGIRLGAGRERVEERIDPVAGFELHVKQGDRISKGAPLITVYGSSRARVREVSSQVAGCVEISESAVKPERLILKRY